jgi:hypothetical protein
MFKNLTIRQNQRLEFILLGLVILLMLLATSCKHQPMLSLDDVTPQDTTGNGNNNTIPQPCDPDTVYFANTILPLFISNCAKSGCHDATTHEEGLVLDSYSHIMASHKIVPYNSNDGDIPEVITSTDPDKVMPPPPNAPLTSQQINLILTWINQGAQNNYCDDCDTLNVTWSGKIKPLIDLKCRGCHSGSNPPQGINLSTYTGVQGIALTGSLMGSIRHLTGYSAMPKNSPSLPQCEIDAIRIWVDAGAQNN